MVTGELLYRHFYHSTLNNPRDFDAIIARNRYQKLERRWKLVHLVNV